MSDDTNAPQAPDIIYLRADNAKHQLLDRHSRGIAPRMPVAAPGVASFEENVAYVRADILDALIEACGLDAVGDDPDALRDMMAAPDDGDMPFPNEGCSFSMARPVLRYIAQQRGIDTGGDNGE